ncbi:MAG: o-succinylbenzoate synthase [Salibacteraceae bacterium]
MNSYSWIRHSLQFKRPSGTSRGILTDKPSWFLTYAESDWVYPALGEVSIIPGLSADPIDRIESKLNEVCANLNAELPTETTGFPAITFALEMLEADIKAKGSKVFYPTNDFNTGVAEIKINGLIWMGDPLFMLEQIKEKMEQGFRCLKLKIGAIDFEKELKILASIRQEINAIDLEIRVDANGAFTPGDALEKLKTLSEFDIHSIEQPIAPKQWDEMAALCSTSPLDIALDEELIGLNALEEKRRALDTIRPQYIILKPSLLGGLKACDVWISEAEQRGIKWWLTSALESNIGLNAIAQYAHEKDVSMPQGLGTGSLYTNNIDSPLYIHRQFLMMNPNHIWNLKPLNL